MRLEAGRPECIRGSVCVCVCVSTCDVSVCLLACMRRPRLRFLIDPAQHPSDLQDIRSAEEAGGGGEIVRGRRPGRKGEEKKKINSAERIARNLTGREAEIVKLY